MFKVGDIVKVTPYEEYPTPSYPHQVGKIIEDMGAMERQCWVVQFPSGKTNGYYEGLLKHHLEIFNHLGD